MKRILLVLGVVLALLLTAGCGGLNKDEKTASKSISTQFAGPEPSTARKAVSTCFSDKLVSGAGLDQLKKDKVIDKNLKAAKTVPSKLSKKTANAYGDAIVKCYDFKKLKGDLKKQSGASAKQVNAYVSCLDAIDKDDLKQTIVDEYTKTKPSSTSKKVDKETKACGKKLGS